MPRGDIEEKMLADENRKHRHIFITVLKLRLNNTFSQPSFVFESMTAADVLLAFSMV